MDLEDVVGTTGANGEEGMGGNDFRICGICGKPLDVNKDVFVGMGEEPNGEWKVAHYNCYYPPPSSPRVEKRSEEPIKNYGKVASRQSNLAYNLIPWEGLKRVGQICLEGERVYKDKAINGKRIESLLRMDVGERAEWITERWNHAIEHLRLWAWGDRGEDHLAKVGWFCLVMGELDERLKKERKMEVEVDKRLGDEGCWDGETGREGEKDGV